MKVHYRLTKDCFSSRLQLMQITASYLSTEKIGKWPFLETWTAKETARFVFRLRLRSEVHVTDSA